jgi:hypothetical protein
VAEIEKRRDAALTRQHHLDAIGQETVLNEMVAFELNRIISLVDTLEVKDVDLMIHTIIAECCDWLAAHTELSHDEIEGCRNLMLTVKDEQLKAQKEE